MKWISIVVISLFSAILSQSSDIVPNDKPRLKQEILKQPTYSNENGFTVNICFGTPDPQCFYSKLILNRFFSWIPDKDNDLNLNSKYDYQRSESYVMTHSKATIGFNNHVDIMGKHIKETMWFNNKPLASHILLLSATDSKMDTKAEGMLALGYLPASNEFDYSVIEQLKMNGYISHQVFSIKYKNDYEGILQIGKIPINALNDFNNYGRCNAIQGTTSTKEKSEWECTVRDFTIGNMSIMKNSNEPAPFRTITFDYNIEHIQVPLDVMLRIEGDIFRYLIEEGHCNFGIKDDQYKFTCSNEMYNNLNRLEIVFDDWKMIIPQSHLFIFDYVDNEHEFILVHKEGNSNFVLGKKALQLFEMVFDKDNNEIGFYSSVYVEHFSNQPIQQPKRYESIDEDEPPQENVNDGKDRPFVPPFHQDNDNDMNSNDRIIPQKGPFSFLRKFCITFGILLLIVITLFMIWYVFRYYRRKIYASKSLDYKQIKEIF